MTANAIRALWVIDHKARFCSTVKGASPPPKMKWSDLPAGAREELREAGACSADGDGRLRVKPEFLEQYAADLTACQEAYEAECLAARARAEAQFRKLFPKVIDSEAITC